MSKNIVMYAAVLPLVIPVFLGCMLLEKYRGGWLQPARRTWLLRTAFLSSLELATLVAVGYLVRDWWRLPSLFQWDELAAWQGGLCAYLAGSLVFYWWHRLRHEHDWFWRVFHQVHHSSARLETLTAFYKHPVEAVGNALLSSVLVYLVFGLDYTGAAFYTALTLAAQLLVHVNTRTPRWLGWFFQRPEMHRIHHQPGTEHLNYCDIPLWDMLFGSYVNPERFEGQCGFDPAREERLGDMLRFVDVHATGSQAKERS